MSLQSEKIENLVKALVKVQGRLRPAQKDAENPFFKSKYATLQSVWCAAQDAGLAENGLAIVQQTEETNFGTLLWTTLLHESGEWLKASFPIKPVKLDPQGFGSAISYGRRYGLASILGICSEEDDDGNAASSTEKKRPRKEEAKPAVDPVESAKKVFSPRQDFYAKAKALGLTEEKIKEHLKIKFGVESSKDLPEQMLGLVLKSLEELAAKG